MQPLILHFNPNSTEIITVYNAFSKCDSFKITWAINKIRSEQNFIILWFSHLTTFPTAATCQPAHFQVDMKPHKQTQPALIFSVRGEANHPENWGQLLRWGLKVCPSTIQHKAIKPDQ